MPYVVALVVAVLVGCGASSAEVARAKGAIYATRGLTILDVATQVTQQSGYIVQSVDPDTLRITTQPQFYGEEGGRQSPGAGGFVNARGGSVSLTLIIDVLYVGQDNSRVVLRITPKTYQVVSWSPQPRELAPDDPNLPPWIRGRVDKLALEIYKYTKRYEAPRAKS